MVKATSGHGIFVGREHNLQHMALLYDEQIHSTSTQMGLKRKSFDKVAMLTYFVAAQQNLQRLKKFGDFFLVHNLSCSSILLVTKFKTRKTKLGLFNLVANPVDRRQ